MNESKDPSYPWYPRDFEADEPVKLMTLAQEGAYRRLLDHQWLNGSVPGEVEQLARICKNVPVPEMRKLWAVIERCFIRMDGLPIRLQNRRLERERRKRKEHREKQTASGKAGAKARWEKEHGEPNAIALPDPMPNDGFALALPLALAEEPTTSSADAAPELIPHNQQSVMRLIVDRLYFGNRPPDGVMATNGSILRNYAAKRGFEYMARVVTGLALRRDAGKLFGVGTHEAVSLKWLNSAKIDLNQLAVSEDAYFQEGGSVIATIGGDG